MHLISIERALAHWRTLCLLPQDQLNFLEERFTQEQPLLARALGELTDAVDCPAEAWQSPEADARLAQFGQMLVRGSCLAELFRREAGHALRRLDETEINSILESNVRLADALEKAPGPGGPDWFTTSAQPDLLRGIVVGHLSVEGCSDREGKAVSIFRFLVQAMHRACGDARAGDSGDWDAGRIGVALSVSGDPLRRDALAACDSFRAELTPRFIAVLESWVQDPRAALEEDASLGMHGMFLLAKWRGESAWPVFRKLFSLPGDIAYDLLGDLITEHAPMLLAMVGRHRRDELRQMVEDERLDEFCRGACLEALTLQVAWEELPQAEHVAWLRELLTGRLREINENAPVLAAAVSAVCDVEGWELRPEVEAAFARGAVEDTIVDLKFFLDAQKGRPGDRLREFRARHRPMVDVAATTTWLDEPPSPEDAPLPLANDEARVLCDSAQPYQAPAKVGRNEPCPCGSGKKYKKCCGA